MYSQEAATDPTYRDSFKPQQSKDDKKTRRKQILAAIGMSGPPYPHALLLHEVTVWVVVSIQPWLPHSDTQKFLDHPISTHTGEDLLLASADKPFRFPATFTFVVRSFTVLDGIGKGLDPRFDISEIAAPYARGLLLEAAPQLKRVQDDFAKRWKLQDRAVRNLFTGPNMIEDVANSVRRMERGDLKLRVRALEAERALSRVAVRVFGVGGVDVAVVLTKNSRCQGVEGVLCFYQGVVCFFCIL